MQEFTQLIIPSNGLNWIYSGSVLEAKTLGGLHLEKFSWNPITGEFLFIWPSQHHSSSKGSAPFEDYVRGIILRKRREIAFRTFQGGSENSIRAQVAAENALKIDGAASDWSFRYNVTNQILEELTGERGW